MEINTKKARTGLARGGGSERRFGDGLSYVQLSTNHPSTSHHDVELHATSRNHDKGGLLESFSVVRIGENRQRQRRPGTFTPNATRSCCCYLACSRAPVELNTFCNVVALKNPCGDEKNKIATCAELS